MTLLRYTALLYELILYPLSLRPDYSPETSFSEIMRNTFSKQQVELGDISSAALAAAGILPGHRRLQFAEDFLRCVFCENEAYTDELR
jgi:hypothetical protein